MIHGVCQAESPKPSRPHFSARTLARRIVGDIKLPIRRHRPPPTPWARPARPPPTTRGTVSTPRLWGAQGPHSIDGRVDCRVPRRGDLVSTEGDTCLDLSWIIRARAVPCIGSGARVRGEQNLTDGEKRLCMVPARSCTVDRSSLAAKNHVTFWSNSIVTYRDRYSRVRGRQRGERGMEWNALRVSSDQGWVTRRGPRPRLAPASRCGIIQRIPK